MKYLRTCVGIITVMLLSIAHTQPVGAAKLFFQPQQHEVVTGQHFIVELHLDSEDETINAVGATVTYDRELLRPVNIIQDSSFLTLWPEEPTINENTGTITLTGGVPGGSLVVDGRVVGIEFEAIKSGTAWVQADHDASMVLLNDGVGTAADLTTVPATYTVSAVSSLLLDVSSSTHPDELTWYPSPRVELTWEPRDTALYSFILSMNEDDTPDALPEATVDHALFSDVADGAYTFILSEKLSNEDWHVVARRPVLVDTTAPQAFTPRLSTDVIPGSQVVVFSTTDAASGIDHYELIDGTTVVRDAQSPYRLLTTHSHGTIVVRAFDRAGNVTEGVLTITEHSTTDLTLRYGGIAAGVILLTVLAIALRRSRHT